jgi:predicted RNA-binding Zn ribbon-like protein
MTSTATSHAHAGDLEAFLELVNTLEYSDGEPQEHLQSAADAVEFFASRGLAHREALVEVAAHSHAGEDRLERVHAVRSAAREVWDAIVEHRSPDRDAVERVNAGLRHPPLVELTLSGDGCGVGHRHVGDPWDEAITRTLEPFVAAVAAGDVDRFRICANDGCRWVFRDESRAGRRRWCDMSSCGNRAKAARFRARRKAAGSD